MLPRHARLTRRDDFRLATRRGRRAARGTLVAHLCIGDSEAPARAGFVVGRAVGGSVIRHRVQRRLRHVVRDRLDRLPDGGLLVVRALPRSAEADSAELARDLDRAISNLLAPASGPRR